MRIGIDLGGTNLRAGLVAGDGQVLKRCAVPTPAQETAEATVAAMAGLVEELGGAELIGVGAPGLVDAAGGVVRTSPNLPRWRDVALANLLRRKTKSRVLVANDVNAIAWGEHLFGAGRGLKDMLCITLGTGLGGAFIISGRLHLGKDQTAGEIGHVVIEKGGYPCPCGSRGCLEQYVAKNAIIRLAEAARPESRSHTPESVARAAQRGEEWAIGVYREVGERLAIVLAGLVQMLNLEKIVVGGQIAKAGTVLFGPLEAAMTSLVSPMLAGSYTIEPAGLGADAGIIGAAFLDRS
jgi:glucokinase